MPKTKKHNSSKQAFSQQIKRFQDLIDTIKRESSYLSAVTAPKVKSLLEEYTVQAEGFDYILTDAQQKQLKSVRAILSKEERQSINRKIKAVLLEKEKAAAKIEAIKVKEEKKHNEALTIVNSLTPRVQAAANAFKNANLRNKDELLKSYKEKRSTLAEAIQKLPKDQYRAYSILLQELSTEVNSKAEVLNADESGVKKTIAKAIHKTTVDTKKMTVQQLVLAIAPGITKNALQNILNSASIQAILQSPTTADNALVLADLPKDTQNALIVTLLKELGEVNDLSKQGVALRAFYTTIVSNITQLVSGEKTHISLITEVNGTIHSVNINIKDLLGNPEAFITETAYQLLLSGVRNESITITLSSVGEVNAIHLLEGNNISLLKQGTLSEVTGKIMAAAHSTPALRQILGDVIPDNALIARSAYAPSAQGINTDQLADLVRTLVTIIKSRGVLTLPEYQAGLAPVLNIHPEISAPAQASTLEYHSPIDATPPIPPVPPTQQSNKPGNKPPFIDLSQYAEKFDQLVSQLDDIISGLKLKGEKNPEKYKKVINAAKTLKTELQAEGGKFFRVREPNDSFHTNPQQEFLAFRKGCKTAVTKAALEFRKHRDVWNTLAPVLKGFLGIIATIFVIPAIVVAVKAKDGYVNTFFGTPSPTNSSKTIEELASNFDSNADDLRANINKGLRGL